MTSIFVQRAFLRPTPRRGVRGFHRPWMVPSRPHIDQPSDYPTVGWLSWTEDGVIFSGAAVSGVGPWWKSSSTPMAYP